MNKFISFIIALGFIVPIAAHADTIADLQARLQVLIAQLAALQLQLNNLSVPSSTMALTVNGASSAMITNGDSATLAWSMGSSTSCTLWSHPSGACHVGEVPSGYGCSEVIPPQAIRTVTTSGSMTITAKPFLCAYFSPRVPA